MREATVSASGGYRLPVGDLEYCEGTFLRVSGNDKDAPRAVLPNGAN
jgi:hypothetical protein